MTSSSQKLSNQNYLFHALTFLSNAPYLRLLQYNDPTKLHNKATICRELNWEVVSYPLWKLGMKGERKCLFGLNLYRIDSDRIYFERIDLCLDTIMYNWLNRMNVVCIVLIKIVFDCIITKIEINGHSWMYM